MNCHHQGWLGSTMVEWVLLPRTVMVLRPLTSQLYQVVTTSQLYQLVTGPTHARGGTLDFLMTDVLDLVRVAVVAPLGKSDHSSLSAQISIKQTINNLWVSRRILLNHRVN